MEIYLIRHTSVDVPAGYAYGQTDVPLKSSFEAEAEIVRDNLRGLTFDKVWTSPLTRCRRLAAYCGYPDAEPDARLKEIDFGEWEMHSWEEISLDPRSKKWFESWIFQPAPRGESLVNQYERVRYFLESILQSGLKRVCLFTHGGVIACARSYAGEFPLEEAFKHVPPYGGIVTIKTAD